MQSQIVVKILETLSYLLTHLLSILYYTSLAVICLVELFIRIVKIFILFPAVVKLDIQAAQICQTLLETVLLYWC
jgi:hypothetical protein